MRLYRLDIHKNIIPCSFDEWCLQWSDDKIVKKDKFGGVEVSTVFLGMDHSFRGSKPILFETMIFGGDHDGYQKRYETWDDALKGHLEACQLADWLSNEREKKLGDLGV